MKTTKQGVKLAICAWCDSHALDVADGEIVDLVRRLQSLDAMTGCDADGIERIVTDLMHFAADRIEGEPEKAGRLRRLAAHISETLVAVGLTVDARCVMPDREREPDSPTDWWSRWRLTTTRRGLPWARRTEHHHLDTIRSTARLSSWS